MLTDHKPFPPAQQYFAELASPSLSRIVGVAPLNTVNVV